MILDREKSFSKLETGFEKVNEIVKEIEPRAIKKNLDKKEKKILETEVRIEKLENYSKELTKQTQKVRKVLDKVKSFENLVGVADKVKKYLGQAEETKNYSDRIAGKVETIFEDINNKMIDLDNKSAKLEKIDELLKEIVPTMDKLKTEISNKADKKDVLSLQKSGVSTIAEEKINKIENQSKESQNKLDEKINKIENQSKESKNKLGDLEEFVNKRDKELEEIKEKLSLLHSKEKAGEGQKTKIKSLENEIEDINKSYNNKEIDEQTYKKKLQERKGEIEKIKSDFLVNLEEQIKKINEDKKFLEDYKEVTRLVKPRT